MKSIPFHWSSTVKTQIRFFIYCGGWTFFLLLLLCTSLFAQEKEIPGYSYSFGIGAMREGRNADAIKELESGLRGGLKIATERWLDSICYAAMLGEAHYQLGQFPQALENFDTAIRLSIQYSNWLTKIQNVPNPGMFNLKPVPWGDPNPARGLLNVPEKFSILFGDLNYGQKYRHGGVAVAPQLKSIGGTEIVRSTMLAMRRRAELLGPLGAGDELNTQLVAELSKTQRALAGSWFQAWLDIEIGLGYATAGKRDEAMQSLMRGALINGSAHCLTPVAYVELGKIQLKAGNYEKAYNLFLEAATVGFYFEDVEIMTEAFEGLETAYCQRNQQMICPPLVAAAEWAKIKKLNVLFATIQAARTDDFLRLRQLKPAMECLALGEKAISRQDQVVSLGRLGAVLNYQKARIAFQNPSPASQQAGFTSLEAAMRYMRFGARWNFHIQQVDFRLLNGMITARKALDAYRLLLREPTATDWALNPIESMGVTVTPRPGTWENFFLCAIEMEKKEDALEISEYARRAAYLQTLDFGGRLHSLRLLLEGPEKDLTIQQAQRKRDILAEHPEYENCSKKARALQMKIRQMSLPVPEGDSGKATELAEALKNVRELAQVQEAILTSMVLDRRVIDVVFPRVRTCKEVQESLPKGEAMLVCFAARGQMFLFLMNNEQMAMWKIYDSSSATGSTSSRKKKEGTTTLTSLQTNFSALLKDVGLGGGTVQARVLNEADWKKDAQRVMADLTKNSQANFASGDFSSLVIVPDRFIWYLPFEALQIQTPKGMRPTISQFSIRYAPMASLGTPWKHLQLPKSPYSLITVGKKAPANKTVNQLAKKMERSVIFDEKNYAGIEPGTPGTASPIFASEFDKMFVFEDLNNKEGESYSIFPMALDRTAKEGATLGHWFFLPMDSPRLVVLGGFKTGCESLAKKSSSKSSNKTNSKVPHVPGEEFFLTSMAFLANGTDTVILPRWTLEGAAPWRLTAMFVELLPEAKNSADAWRKAVLKFALEEVRLDSEPRIGKSDEVERFSASHPFFWAGNMLIDSGSGSLRSEELLAEAVDAEEEEEEAGPSPAKTPKLLVPEQEDAENAEEEADEESAEEEADEEADEDSEEDSSEVAPQPKKPRKSNGRLAPLPPMGGAPLE